MQSRQNSTNTWLHTDRPSTQHEKAPTLTVDADLTVLGYDEVATMLGISTRTLHRHVVSGEFPRPFKIGRRPVWLRERVFEHLVQSQTNAEKGKKKRGVRRMLDGALK